MSCSENKKITIKLIEEYLRHLKEKGRKGTTVSSTRRTLLQWYRSLPEDKLLTEDAMDRWGEVLREKHVAAATVSNNMSMLNRFLKYLEDPDLIQELGFSKEREGTTREKAATRDEYQWLLYTARSMGYRRTYLLIKTICCLGIRSTEMPQLTSVVYNKE